MESKRVNPIKLNLVVDFTILVAFLIALDPRTTGIAIHEWLSIAMIAAIITHLLLHWRWVVQVTTRFFRKLAGQARLNYFLNILFFIDFVIVTFSGLLISESALPALGIRIGRDMAMRRIHSLSADLSVFIIGLHVALHWKWILSSLKRYIVQPVARRIKRTQPELVTTAEVEA